MWQPTSKAPAWLSLLTPGKIDFEVVTDSQAQCLRKVLAGSRANSNFQVKENSPVERVALDGRFLDLFRCQGQLLKVSQEALPHLERLHALAEHLHSHGVPTPKPTVSPVVVEGLGVVTAVEYKEHRPVDATENDMSSFGRALASLHLALDQHPQCKDWIANTEQRLRVLNRRRAEIQAGKKFGPLPDRLRELAQTEDLDFAPQRRSRRFLHGDLNYSNAFISEGQLFLFDFEDVFHSHLPTEFEWVYVFERFLMVRELEDDLALRCMKAFASAYRESYLKWEAKDSLASVTQATDPFSGVDWWSTLLSINLRSLCVLAELEAQGNKVPLLEWQKFFDLLALAEKKKAFWQELRL